MRLKKLESFGFKSFADRMTFDFDDGITAIIGPNGCGKSNIVDSIKWVIGEQSAKALRGAEMSDIIFNGCATRRAMPLAEVTLTLDDVPGSGEVAITRRLTRDGQSSYYINGKSSRLKDIKDLLMGTGLATSAYSVIEQGRIGFILEASTKDRRAIIEEAAGISRFKARRAVAMRKLERVENDIVRIDQLVGEVQRRHKTVHRQAETALKYQELSKTLRELRMVFALEEYGRQHTELSDHQEKITVLSEQAAAASAELGKLAAELEGALTRLDELEITIRESDDERGRLRSERDVAATRVRDSKHRLIEIDQQEADDQQQLQILVERLQALADDIAQRQSEAESDGDTVADGLAEAYGKHKQDLDAALVETDRLLAEVEQHKAAQIEALRGLDRIEAETHALEATDKNLADRAAKINERASGQQTAEAAANEALEVARQKTKTADESCTTAHATLDDLIREREAKQAAGQEIEGKLNDMRHEEGRAEVRLRLLSDIEKRQEGLQGGVRHVIKAMDRFPGLHGIVADCFSVDADLELAIETALGGRAQNIITDTQATARRAIDHLKQNRLGRATFLPLDDVRGRAGISQQVRNAPGVIGEACDLIDYDRQYDVAFEYLLGGIVICDTIDDAINLRRNYRRDVGMIVTRDGEVINPGGAMTGGRQQGRDGGGLVSRKNEIRRLEGQLKTITSDREKLMVQRDESKKAAFEAAIAVDEHRRVIQQAERELGEAKAEVMKAERDLEHRREAGAGFQGELAEIASERQRLREEAATINERRATFTAQQSAAETKLVTAQEALTAAATHRDALQEEVAKARVDLATSEERREALRNHIAHLQRQEEDLLRQRDERQGRIQSLGQRRSDLQTAIAESEVTHQEAEAKFNDLAAKLDALLKERDEIRIATESERQRQTKLQNDLRQAERQQADHERLAGEITVRVQALVERMADEYNVDLVTSFEQYERPDDLDLPQVRRDLSETEAALNRLGPVNLTAIDELKEVEARRDFLVGHHEDLTQARETLSEIIDHINTESRRKFMRTYKDVRRGFQDLFRKLYGGGKADMVLQMDEGNDDPLEAGIEIIAQPPGKQPKSITLLSGGEKALTAIALLFAVYQTKPSPFCILDEVDAPLDESNTDVYCQMVKEFCDRSQFLVITHNKRTMQFADAIYGITQYERGISTKISVKLDDIEKVGSDGNVDNVAGPVSDTVRGQGPFAEVAP